MKLKISESQLQSSYFDWVRQMQNLDKRFNYIFAIPNGSKLGYFRNKDNKIISPQAIKAKKEGLTKGVWDVEICQPYFNIEGQISYIAAFIEFKTGYNKLTKEQENFKEGHGYCWFKVCYDVDDAINFTNEYLGCDDKRRT